MRNKLISFCLTLWILAALPLTVMAQQFDYDRKGSISVTLVTPDGGQPVVGAELSVYHVATVGINTEGKLNYIFTDEFDDFGLSINDPDLTKKLDAIVSDGTFSPATIITDSQGKASCGDLPLGLYLVKQTGSAEGFARCVSFLVTVPMETENGYVYHVDASPKAEMVRLIDITVKKVWNEGKSGKIPDSVTVQLLRDGEVLKTATLNKQNNWQITYTDLPESDAYRIKEVNVPKGFTATYTQKGYVFTVTNTATLAQTGQLIWPIPVLAMVGLFFLLLGFAILRKPEKNHA